MLLTIESSSPDLSFLLHKHPEKLQSFELNFGTAHVFYPDSNRAALALEIDPLSLTKRGGAHPFALKPYVNDRSYVACSFLSVAINRCFRSAMSARCDKRPELVEQTQDYRVTINCLPCRGGPSLLRQLFEPLGYEVEASPIPLDPKFESWGDSVYHQVSLSVHSPLYRVLRHLYILIPVLDDEKHYWVGSDEVDKLLNKGQDWLQDHPKRDLVVRRYLRHQGSLSRRALEELEETQETSSEDLPDEVESRTEKALGLHQQRLDLVFQKLRDSGAKSVADLGCGEGKLLKPLLQEKQFERVLGMDVCSESLHRAKQRLEQLHPKRLERLELIQGSLLYNDHRLKDVDAACLVEVIEHIEPDGLERAATNLFERIGANTIIITTPNADYNGVWESLPAGRFRHPDHRFEWTRAEFRQWCEEHQKDYELEILDIGETSGALGAPSQMAVFSR